ncbi:hypothetical protein DEU56DRAFT_211864 [Suillus clintonianus]|uniref:uncharacterized protein n=1 Tax=Suillus clintonianus TaxID=1904413 RepID=UPI001B85FC46|nr:uncharacterized protein DEU56DRAFT_211864 [Suillus clintonianus]KAG2111758.1 hypothetical protein DEU56DRAFT_211864 [Suillus clintonianus]
MHSLLLAYCLRVHGVSGRGFRGCSLARQVTAERYISAPKLRLQSAFYPTVISQTTSFITPKSYILVLFPSPKAQWTHSQTSSLCCPLQRPTMSGVPHRQHQLRRSRNQTPEVVTASLHERGQTFCTPSHSYTDVSSDSKFNSRTMDILPALIAAPERNSTFSVVLKVS